MINFCIPFSDYQFGNTKLFPDAHIFVQSVVFFVIINAIALESILHCVFVFVCAYMRVFAKFLCNQKN